MLNTVYVFLGLLIASCAVSILDWKSGIICAVVLGSVSDLFRKLTPGEPLWMSHAVVLVWLTSIGIAFNVEWRSLSYVRSRIHALGTIQYCWIFALVPAAIISLASYNSGWLLVLVGGASYAAPLFGLLLGCLYGKCYDDLRVLMCSFAISNGLVLVGNYAEFLKLPWYGLGGLSGMDWIRHTGVAGSSLDLVSGFYRSPDISGFYAAHVCIFSGVLASKSSPKRYSRYIWISLTVFSIIALIFTGRRKVIFLPVLCLIFIYVLKFFKNRGQHGISILMPASVIAFLFIGFFAIDVAMPVEVDLGDHSLYLVTTFTDTGPKLVKSFDSVMTTINQSGLLGAGLGVATQGNRYVVGDELISRSWQEDGVSRVFRELGVPGVISMSVGLIALIGEFVFLMSHPLCKQRSSVLEIGLSIFLVNSIAYIISHQHFSGNVQNALVCLIFLGAAISQPAFQATQVKSVS